MVNPIVMWMRLKDTIVMNDVCELADVTPTRFLGLIIRPLGETWKATEMGKVMGTLMSDQVNFSIIREFSVFLKYMYSMLYYHLRFVIFIFLCTKHRSSRRSPTMQTQKKPC